MVRPFDCEGNLVLAVYLNHLLKYHLNFADVYFYT